MIEALERKKSFHGGDVDVHFAYPSGDYWRNTLAARADSVDDGVIVWSEYHREHRLVDEEEEESIVDGLCADADEDRPAAEDLSTELGRRIAEKTPRTVVVIS